MTVWTRIKLAFAAFFSILFKGRLPSALDSLSHAEASVQPGAGGRPESSVRAAPMQTAPVQAAPVQTASIDTSADRAVQVLALLQREGRFVDFVLEDLSAYSDAQIGAAARDIHAGCRRVLERYVSLEAIVTGREGDAITVGQDQPFDPAAWHLVGNVTGQPPFRGTLLHSGWRVSRVELPQLPPQGSTGRRIVAPAQIEIA